MRFHTGEGQGGIRTGRRFLLSRSPSSLGMWDVVCEVSARIQSVVNGVSQALGFVVEVKVQTAKRRKS